tara:strand:- start:322 stop:513 length:192 start_codon:yes stop_codon:yes gene_type:complete
MKIDIQITADLICDLIALWGKDKAKEELHKLTAVIIDANFDSMNEAVEAEMLIRAGNKKALGL